MKISKMLEREDFYSILEATLNRNGTLLGISGKVKVTDPARTCTLFINPRLNAIISRHPSKEIKDFLYTEYSVSGSLVRRLAVNFYVWVSITFVRLFADKGIQLAFEEEIDVDDVLIYPCNKKIRCFNFKRGSVISCLKEGFPATYINREMQFRESNSYSFIPRVYNCKRNNAYEETIIQGTPLARVQDTEKKRRLLDNAYCLMKSLSLGQENIVMATDYIDNLCTICIDLLDHKEGLINTEEVRAIFKTLGSNSIGQIKLVLSHGDFQPGNIWVSTNSDIIIIDWETVKPRSPFYDYVALYCDLRMNPSKQALFDKILSSKELPSLFNVPSETIARVVLAEELAYQTEELLSFPSTIGVKEYMSIISQYKNLKYD